MAGGIATGKLGFQYHAGDMTDQKESIASEPKTLKLQRKEHAFWLIVLGIIAMVAAIAFAIYKIYSATLPPDLP